MKIHHTAWKSQIMLVKLSFKCCHVGRAIQDHMNIWVFLTGGATGREEKASGKTFSDWSSPDRFFLVVNMRTSNQIYYIEVVSPYDYLLFIHV